MFQINILAEPGVDITISYDQNSCCKGFSNYYNDIQVFNYNVNFKIVLNGFEPFEYHNIGLYDSYNFPQIGETNIKDDQLTENISSNNTPNTSYKLSNLEAGQFYDVYADITNKFTGTTIYNVLTNAVNIPTIEHVVIENIEMINDVKALKKNDPKAIVVLLGDHGPALTKNCRELRNFKISSIDKYDIQDRYGTFLAIHEPKDLVFEGGDVQLIQDIFPAILTNITNNKQLFNELKLERKFFGRFNNRVGGVNILDGIIIGGKDDGKPLFEKRSYQIKE